VAGALLYRPAPTLIRNELIAIVDFLLHRSILPLAPKCVLRGIGGVLLASAEAAFDTIKVVWLRNGAK